MPYIGKSPNFGVRNKFVYLASASDTSVSGADANGATLTFTDGAYVDVYLNGVLLKPTTDYNTTTANTIAGLSALNTSDEVTVVVYDVFAVSDTVSATSGGTFNSGVTIQTADNTDTLTLVSTDADNLQGPVLNFFRNSASPADSDSIGHIEFKAENDASEVVRYARIRGRIDDVTDGTEDSKLIFETITAGATQENVRFEPNSIVFNEGSADVDFRVETDGKTHAFFIEGSSNNISMGTTTPTFATGNGLHLGDDFHIGFGDGNGTRPDFQLGYDATNTRLSMKCGTGSDDTDIMITTGGQAVIGGSSVVSSSMLSVISGSDARVMTLESDGTGANDAILIKNGNGEVGTVRTSGSSTAYNTSSDYRLKENVNYSWDATTRLKQLKPARFNFKADADLTVDGFLAHEVSSIVPEAISGIKDEVDEDKKPVYQGIDQSKLVPLLVKTIQELEARVTALESK